MKKIFFGVVVATLGCIALLSKMIFEFAYLLATI